uniref:Kelch-like protein diablo n=2 Tax=Glossina palpalis gambiensis TaxID=67801 RepID=A0A1B0BJT1_9MUSC
MSEKYETSPSVDAKDLVPNFDADAMAKTFHHPDYCHTFLDALNKMRVNQQHCDFCLDVKGEKIYVHKVALIFVSPYFAAMLNSDMQEKASGSVKLQEEDATIVKALVEYIYTGIITLTESNAQLMLSVANLFQMKWLKEQCEQFLKSQVKATNCFEMRSFADAYSCKELFDYSQTYILQHFDEIIYAKEFLSLPFEEIKKLIMDDNTSVKFEDNAYKAVIKWIKHDLEERKVHLGELMGHVRLPFVRSEYLRKHIISEPLLRSDQECSQVLVEVLRYKLTPVNERNSLRQFKTNRNEKFRVLLVGGRTQTARNLNIIYDVSENKVTLNEDMMETRYANSAIFLNGVVYSVGGCGSENSRYNSGYNSGYNSVYNSEYDLKTAERYDMCKRQWSYISSMSTARRHFGICTYNDRIYVVGGNQVSSVESYDPKTNVWTMCASTPARYANGNRIAVVGNSIYSMGCEASLIRFDPREGRWNNLGEASRDLQTQFELVSYDHSLFRITLNCERFDVRTHKWEPMPSMPSQLSHRAAVMISDDIYIIGGYKNERYNINYNEWTTVDSTEFTFCDGGAAVIKDT